MLEVVEEYLCTFRVVNGTSLSYVVRKKLVPTAEAGGPSNEFDTIYEEMVARYPVTVAGTFVTIAALEANGPFIVSYLTCQAKF